MATSGHTTLPLPDYDELPVGAVENRIRSLSTDQVEQLLDHERSHADRPSVEEILSARLERLREGAEPTSGNPAGTRPERADASARGSRVSPDTSPQPSSPPPHGTPDQPGKPKGNRT